MSLHEQKEAAAVPLEDLDSVDRTVRIAARTLSRHGFVHAYGHCSQRLDDDFFLVSAAKPLGTIQTADRGTRVPIHGALPEDVLGEVRIHREIYRRRPDVGGVIRSMPPRLMSLSVLGRTPRLVHGMSAYFVDGVALWNDPQLIRDDDSAGRLADTLGNSNGLLMRGNGAVVAGASLQDAVVLSWYLEDAARIELDCLEQSDEVRLLSEGEARKRATRSGRIFERMWDYLTFGDPEL